MTPLQLELREPPLAPCAVAATGAVAPELAARAALEQARLDALVALPRRTSARCGAGSRAAE